MTKLPRTSNPVNRRRQRPAVLLTRAVPGASRAQARARWAILVAEEHKLARAGIIAAPRVRMPPEPRPVERRARRTPRRRPATRRVRAVARAPDDDGPPSDDDPSAPDGGAIGGAR